MKTAEIKQQTRNFWGNLLNTIQPGSNAPQPLSIESVKPNIPPEDMTPYYLAGAVMLAALIVAFMVVRK